MKARPGTRDPGLGTVAAILILIAPTVLAQEQRIASDFEIQSAQRELTRQRDPLLKMAAHLNLGDLYLSRRETATAQTHYGSARELAVTERLRSRRHSDLSSYATATAYLGFAEAKLGRAAAAFDAFEEAMRYASDSAKLWNLYSSGMNLLGHPQKAVAAARRAVRIAESSAGSEPSAAILLDRAIYRYALASALLLLDDSSAKTEAGEILRDIIHLLTGPAFEPIRSDIARQEKFEIYSTTRTDTDAYLSLMNRTRLRLARLYEERGAISDALEQLRAVLELRTDEPTALRAMARLTAAREEREQFFAQAFDANPFSTELIREYEEYVRANQPSPRSGETTSARMQRAVHAIATDQYREAEEQLAWLKSHHANNAAVESVSSRIAVLRDMTAVPEFLTRDSQERIDVTAEDLRRLINSLRANQLTPEQRARLDELTLSALVQFSEPIASTNMSTTFSGGVVEGINFRFQQPVEFRGVFQASQPVRLDFRVLAVSDWTLILEPIRISPR